MCTMAKKYDDASLVKKYNDVGWFDGEDAAELDVLRDVMMIHAEACGTEFDSKFFPRGRPSIDDSDKCPDGDPELCAYAMSTTQAPTTAKDYVALVRPLSRADLRLVERAIYADANWNMGMLREFRRMVHLWELICLTEAPEVWEVWDEPKPEPWPHDESQRDGNCPNVEPTTTPCTVVERAL
uniref:Tail assembly chaperone n=1 Tax=Steinernema glaseri TaxID=37863 RepID=A0A1I7YPB0_9BILA